MLHAKPISRRVTVQSATTDTYESLILVVMAIFFKDWDNFTTVYTNLASYFSKTP